VTINEVHNMSYHNAHQQMHMMSDFQNILYWGCTLKSVTINHVG